MEPDNIFEIFLSWENPAIYALLFLLILISLVFLIRNEFITPLVNSKRKLVLENAKLAALYSEIDPDPIIRVNEHWNVLDMNNAAKKIFGNSEDGLQSLLLNIRNNSINKDKSPIEQLEGRYYSVIIKDIPELNYKHIYLSDITDRIEFEKQIENYKDRLKQLRIRLDNTNEKEKRKIGTDLHDGVGSNISLLKIEVQNYMFSNSLSLEDNGAIKLFESIDNLSNEVRNLSHEMRPRILDESGLAHAIKSDVEIRNIVKKSFGEVTQNVDFRIVDKEIENYIYKICQEAIQNIAKHSKCRKYFIDFYAKDNNLKITIADDGIGFNVEEECLKKNGSLGLFSMRERADAIGGSLKINSMLSLGTSVFMEFNIGKFEV